MGDVPGPSTAPYFSPRKATENYARLCQLIMTICNDLFRHILSQYIKPANLRTELNNNKATLLSKRLLNTGQKDLLYPKSQVPFASKDMDLSLLYILLRNICKIPPHNTGWGNIPGKGDNSLAACIDRIRIHRNSIAAHSSTGETEDSVFHDIWAVIKSDIVEIESQLIGGDMYQRGVDELFDCELNPSRVQKYVKAMGRIQLELRIKEERIDGLEGNIICLTDHIESKRARIDAIEEQHNSDAKDLKDALSRMDEKITAQFDAIKKLRTADTKKLEDRLSRIEEKMTGMKVDFKSTISVSGMSAIRHISFLTPDALWVSNGYKIKQVNSKGDVIKTVPDKYVYASDGGFHSVSKEGDLCFIGWIQERGAVYRMTSDGRITRLVQSELSCDFTCIHCSHINGDILIGVDSRNCRLRILGVLRYDSTGRRIQEIEFKDQEHTERLYGQSQYITENRINGDIVVSDELKEALVVMDRSGRHRFDYRGHDSLEVFHPVGVCTDGLGRILVAHYLNYFGYNYTTCISVLDQDGRFLYTLLKEDGRNPCTALYVDDKFNIYFGRGDKIKVLKESNFP